MSLGSLICCVQRRSRQPAIIVVVQADKTVMKLRKFAKEEGFASVNGLLFEGLDEVGHESLVKHASSTLPACFTLGPLPALLRAALLQCGYCRAATAVHRAHAPASHDAAWCICLAPRCLQVRVSDAELQDILKEVRARAQEYERAKSLADPRLLKACKEEMHHLLASLSLAPGV